NKKFKGQEGIWSAYVENHLLPRLNGFELLMASYAMAHLQLDLLLKETGFKATTNQRTRVYLTNSLEEYHPDTGTLFANWLSSEANEANHIKRDTPVMCVIGNPPYSISSSNNSPWIENLVQDYKKNLNERNIQPLSDDYIKFIRYGQHFIEKKGNGVLAYISNNSFIDGIIHRQMRKYLLESFDKIYILDLHGNAKKKEISENGSPDKNVFDIMVGVSINIFIKTGTKKRSELAKVFIEDLKGKRDSKYDYLNENDLSSIPWKLVKNFDSKYSFKIQDKTLIKEYENNCFSLNTYFEKGANGIKTERDVLTIQFHEKPLHTIKKDIINYDVEEFRIKYNLAKDGRDWKIETAKKDLTNNASSFTKVHYRPFDYRHSIYTGKSKGFHSYPRHNIHQHLINKDNISLILGRQGQAVGSMPWNLVFINNSILDSNMFYRGGNMNYPLYIYHETNGQQTIEKADERTPNLNQKIVKEIAEKLDLTFTNEKEAKENTFAPIDILDYIYAVLHSPTYREKYKEFLKIDFPRVPYPKDKVTFWQLVKLGGEIRQIHLLESPKVEDYITTYPKDGDNVIKTKIGKKDWELFDEEKQLGRIWINEEQYFDNIPVIAWEFYIGGYQPAQKWLKDRKKRTLEFDDILHYQKIIVALSETDRLMNEIDKIEIE
ncbi:MAG: type ISP restriction/modification enzyme, partial [Candidatus Theseobacter exili]|nr:type ISP restriction/modification enzyme [Candidatus Theseobacter exili]